MDVTYNLVSDSAHVGYDLGKGAWWMDRFVEALRSVDPIVALAAFLVFEEGFSPGYARAVAASLTYFAVKHPDWRIIHDGSSDIYLADEVEEQEMSDEGQDPDDPDCLVYRKIGTVYPETVFEKLKTPKELLGGLEVEK